MVELWKDLVVGVNVVYQDLHLIILVHASTL